MNHQFFSCCQAPGQPPSVGPQWVCGFLLQNHHVLHPGKAHSGQLLFPLWPQQLSSSLNEGAGCAVSSALLFLLGVVWHLSVIVTCRQSAPGVNPVASLKPPAADLQFDSSRSGPDDWFWFSRGPSSGCCFPNSAFLVIFPAACKTTATCDDGSSDSDFSSVTWWLQVVLWDERRESHEFQSQPCGVKYEWMTYKQVFIPVFIIFLYIFALFCLLVSPFISV